MRKTLLATTVAAATGLMALSPAGLAGNAAKKKTAVVGYGLAGANGLVKFDVRQPSRARLIARVRGLAPGERLVGIDFRPRTGELVGLGSAANLYAIDTKTGAAARKSSLTAPSGPVGLDGTRFGVDFNPTVDRLRVVSNREQNLRINVDTGATTIDKPLNYLASDRGAGSDPSAVGAAYTNNDNDEVVMAPATSTPGKTGTQLYDIDSALDSLVLQAPPNDGVLKTIGALRVSASPLVGFDIFSTVRDGRAVKDTAFASLRTRGRTRLYTLNLKTGKATRSSGLGSRALRRVSDIAIRPQG